LNQHAAALFSAVEGVSSINTGTNSGQPSIRGLFGSRVGIIVDGIPQQNQQWGIDHGLDIDPWLIQQYAVHKTGAGLLLVLLPVAVPLRLKLHLVLNAMKRSGL